MLAGLGSTKSPLRIYTCEQITLVCWQQGRLSSLLRTGILAVALWYTADHQVIPEPVIPKMSCTWLICASLTGPWAVFWELDTNLQNDAWQATRNLCSIYHKHWQALHHNSGKIYLENIPTRSSVCRNRKDPPRVNIDRNINQWGHPCSFRAKEFSYGGCIKSASDSFRILLGNKRRSV